MVAAPTANAVTTPLAETPATAASLDSHVTDRPTRTLPASSRRVGVKGTDWPTTSDCDSGETLTEPTGALTVTVAVELFPSMVARTAMPPAPTPVTTPASLTVAIASSADANTATRPGSTLPAASSAAAASAPVSPMARPSVDGVTRTEATGAGATCAVVLPLTPSLVALTIASPSARAVTSPASETVATSVLFELQVTARPVSELPA